MTIVSNIKPDRPAERRVLYCGQQDQLHHILCTTHGMQLTQEIQSGSHVLQGVDYREIPVQNPALPLESQCSAPVKNELHIGDNLTVLRDKLRDESVDLIYLDPPFNSKQDYNVIFRERGGKRSTSQQLVFKDTWKWSPKAEQTCKELIESGGRLSEAIRACRTFLGDSDMMAYIAMMAPRLREMYRVLRPTGALYLHCDPTASHYLKILLDGIFGPDNFRNEIIWKRSDPKGHAYTRYPSTHDVIFFYGKSQKGTWNPQYRAYNESYIKSHYANVEEGTGRHYTLSDCTNPNRNRPNLTYEWRGITKVWRWTKERMQRAHDEGRLVYTKSGAPRYKRYLDEMSGTLVTSIWDDIPFVNSQAQERLSYPTQKPVALLKRIIDASSNLGDTILDPFCGCGTAIEYSQESGRRWIGIDVTYLASAIVKQRLVKFGSGIFKNFLIEGEPVNVDEALALARDNKFGFQCWAVGRLGAPPIENKKGADRGIDGRIYFHDDFGTPKHIVISVKAGEHIGPAFVRELRGVMERERAAMGILVCVKEPTAEMTREAGRAGFYQSLNRDFPKLQIITVEDIFADKALNIPGRLDPFERKKPMGVKPLSGQQLRLLP